jgi:putative cell wall-binding protein
MKKLSDIETLAISKIVTDSAAKKARQKLVPGEYRVGVDIFADIVLTIGEDTEDTEVAQADPWALLTALFSFLAEGKKAEIKDLAEAALAVNPDQVASVRLKFQHATEAMSKPVPVIRKGRVAVSRRNALIIESADRSPLTREATESIPAIRATSEDELDVFAD